MACTVWSPARSERDEDIPVSQGAHTFENKGDVRQLVNVDQRAEHHRLHTGRILASYWVTH